MSKDIRIGIRTSSENKELLEKMISTNNYANQTEAIEAMFDMLRLFSTIQNTLVPDLVLEKIKVQEEKIRDLEQQLEKQTEISNNAFQLVTEMQKELQSLADRIEIYDQNVDIDYIKSLKFKVSRETGENLELSSPRQRKDEE